MAFLSASFFLGVLHVFVSLPSSSSTSLFVIDKRAVLNLDSILSGAPWDRGKFQVCLPFSQLLHQSPKGSSLENSTPSSLTLGLGSPMSTLGLSVGGWEQWNSKWLLVQEMTSCPLSSILYPSPPFLPQQPPEDIKALAWNRQVQHILSSAHPSGKAVVWDLRKNEPIIKVSDRSNRVRRGDRIQARALASFSCLDVGAALPQARCLLSAVALVGSAS